MEARKTRTPQEIRAEWSRLGLSQSEWARRNGFSPATVSQVLNGKNNCARGTGHVIAVRLGIKDGVIVKAENHGRS